MNEFFSFFGTKAGKIVLVLLVLTVIGIIAYKQYEKKMFGGMSKSDIIKDIASERSLAMVKYLKDNKQPDENINDVLIWWEQNRLDNLKIDKPTLETMLIQRGVDTKKYPETLNILQDVNKSMSYLKYI